MVRQHVKTVQRVNYQIINIRNVQLPRSCEHNLVKIKLYATWSVKLCYKHKGTCEVVNSVDVQGCLVLNKVKRDSTINCG